MKENKKEKKDITNQSKSELIHFSWGGTTHEWEEEADQIMNYLQDKLDRKESDDDKERKIQYGKEKQYW